ncbi:MAG: hypothetical protein AAGU78_14925 [Chloroflexota bacterium]|jgi:hypothetical protein|nr:hypothetical protein [Anaerolineae bacterium]HMM27289.1 hypothetical protein [Aggregatilineaceae bacterium]
MSFIRNLTIERLTVAILFLLLFAMAVRIPTDTDTWWHLRAGELIVESGAVPHEDTFSHTRAGHAWVDHSWGAQVLLYGVYRAFGGDEQIGDSGNIGLALYTAALATGGMALVYRMCDGTAYLRAFVVVLGAAAAAVFWSPRPQMLSFFLAALILYVLHRFKRERVDRLWAIPLIMAVWANLHGGFAIGFLLLLGTLAGETLTALLNPDDADAAGWRGVRRLLVVTGVSIPAVAINPYGLKMLAVPFETVGIGVLQDFIQEWASPDFHQRQVWPFALLLLGTLAALGVSGRRAGWTDLALVCGTALMALMAGRNIAVFALAATPVLSRHANAWLDARGWQIRPLRRVSGARLALNWALLLLVLLGALAKTVAALNAPAMRQAQAEAFPVELAAHLRANPPAGRLFNSYNWGGYLLFAAPHVPVYVDGRTDLYDDEFLRRYLSVVLIRDGWDAALDEQAIEAIAIEGHSVLAQMLRERPEQWREQTFDGGRSALFSRAGTADA